MVGRSTPSSFFRKGRRMRRYLQCAGPIRTLAMSTTLGAHAGARRCSSTHAAAWLCSCRKWASEICSRCVAVDSPMYTDFATGTTRSLRRVLLRRWKLILVAPSRLKHRGVRYLQVTGRRVLCRPGRAHVAEARGLKPLSAKRARAPWKGWSAILQD